MMLPDVQRQGKEHTMRLEGKRAIVTGGASGFGREIAATFVREGATVSILDIDEPGARRAAGEIGNAASAFACDVADGTSVDAACEAAIAAMGGLDIVVNNAGWCFFNKPMLDVGEAEFDKVMAVNVKSIYLMTRATLPAMRAQGTGGVIVNIGSTAGIRPRPGLAWYNATKGAVNNMTKSMAVELAPEKIRVVGIAPVAGNTPLLPAFMGGDTPELREKFIATIPMGRLSEPRDIADAALFLVSEEARFLTGNVLEVDGGRTV